MSVIRVYPFTKMGCDVLLHSWFLELEEGTRFCLNKSSIEKIASDLRAHPLSITLRIKKLKSSRHYDIVKEGKDYWITRAEGGERLQYVDIAQSLLEEHGLTKAEIVIYSALLYFHIKEQNIPSRWKLAAMTGYCARKVAYALKSLTEKQLVRVGKQEELYIRNTRKEGRVQGTRVRRVRLVTLEKKESKKGGNKKNKKRNASLKENKKNPVNKNINGLIGSEIKKIRKTFQEVFGEEGAGSERLLGWLVKTYRVCEGQAIMAIQQAGQKAFLKLAYRCGWQEAVVECYQRQNVGIWTGSHHIEKYSSKKLTLSWIMSNINKILSPFYDYKPKKEETFSQSQSQNHTKAQELVKKDKRLVEQQVLQSMEQKNLQEKTLRQTLLERLGAITYAAWFEKVEILTAEGETPLFKTQNAFMRDRVERFLLNLDIQGRVK